MLTSAFILLLTPTYAHTVSSVTTYSVYIFILYNISSVFSLYYFSQVDRILNCFVRLIVLSITGKAKKISGKIARKCLCFPLEVIVWWQEGAQFKKIKIKIRLTGPKMLHCHPEILFENLFSFLIFLTCLSEVFWDIVDFTFFPNT